LKDDAMNLLSRIVRLAVDPPPELVFEITQSGISWVATARPEEIRFEPLDPGVVEVSPLETNVADPVAFARAVDRLAPENGARRGKPRRAALLLPDYAARISVLDFDTFPSVPEEQVALARFRAKKAVPFDIDSAVVGCHAQPRPGSKRIDVTAVVLNMDVASHYEAPFRAAGFQCGFVGVSALSALSLEMDAPMPDPDPVMVAKRSEGAIAVALIEKGSLRMFRCVELHEVNAGDIADILIPTLAYAEDHLSSRPSALLLCGFGAHDSTEIERWNQEAGLAVGRLRSRYAAVTGSNAGLLGYMESLEGGI
jgi:type IV pilus assembly protein PilM